VQRAQIIENLARADVHAIEEAEGFAALMKDHGVTADQLVADTGKSRSYIYGRLKLLQAIPEVREACLRGEFGSETALLIARIGDAKLQQKALKALAAKYISLTGRRHKELPPGARAARPHVHAGLGRGHLRYRQR
jgi:ParB-like chromosome segregation protein Spo0J